MTAERRRTARRCEPYGDADVDGDVAVMLTDAVLDALARREPMPPSADPAVRLLGALIADVDDQRLSSVSITPST